MFFQEQDLLPTLLPLDKKKKETTEEDPELGRNRKQSLSNFQNKKQPQPSPKKNKDKEVEEPLSPNKLEQFEARINSSKDNGTKKEDKPKTKISHYSKEYEKSKQLIEDILKKINSKSITEELYPVTNQTIQLLIHRMEAEIDELVTEKQKKMSSYGLNSTNQQLKRQIEALESSIGRAVTIKELYVEKIGMRNKIKSLEQVISGIKQQNASLKLKINRGIETIKNHMHNLPCQKEKELKEQLNKLQRDWKKEKEMRLQLQAKIEDIVINFKRVYEEADTARLIITKKLQEIREKQKSLETAAAAGNHHYSNDDKIPPRNTPELSLSEDRNKRSALFSQFKELLPNSIIQKTPPKISSSSKRQRQANFTRKKQAEQIQVAAFSMQDQIKKMRSNQITIKKVKP